MVGGGAAGYFGAIACAEHYDNVEVTIFEGTHQPLYKVGISGGGRCNVTHHCFDPELMVEGYPRGSKELLGAFRKFQPRDTVNWFNKYGVELKAEEDGRMFPVSDLSATIIECLRKSAREARVQERLGARVVDVKISDDSIGRRFAIHLKDGATELFDCVMLATGSSEQGYRIAASLRHSIIPPVPSLFTFKIKDARLDQLQGLSFPNSKLMLSIDGKKCFEQAGPVLITHWGLSGPAVLKLSAWGARKLFESRYQAKLQINWIADHDAESVLAAMRAYREENPTKFVMTSSLLPLPRRFWERIVSTAGVDDSVTWSHITRDGLARISSELCQGEFAIIGKGEFKEEFVTCGGVKLKEVDFRHDGEPGLSGIVFGWRDTRYRRNHRRIQFSERVDDGMDCGNEYGRRRVSCRRGLTARRN